jgi:mRNA-degrading endonuclease HigB of HigAB toxin-antitoxin module
MRLIGKERLLSWQVERSAARTWLINWISEISEANWKSPLDVVRQFPRARQKGDSRFVFEVEEGVAEIDLLVAFPQAIALVTDLKVRR